MKITFLNDENSIVGDNSDEYCVDISSSEEEYPLEFEGEFIISDYSLILIQILFRVREKFGTVYGCLKVWTSYQNQMYLLGWRKHSFVKILHWSFSSRPFW